MGSGRRRPSPSRSAFPLLSLTLALPLLALLGFLGWRFFRQAPRSPAIASKGPSATSVKRTGHPGTIPIRPLNGAGTSGVIPVPSNAGRIRIALILDDVGFDEGALEEAASIDGDLNFAILPNAPHAADSARFLTGRGFEILCHLPMEPDDERNSPGSGAVLSSMSDDAVRQTTLASLRAVPNARGVNNHMGSRATADPRVMRDVLSALPQGIYFIDSRTTPHSVGEATARKLDIRTASRDVFLDDVRTTSAVRRQLAELLALAGQKGHAVGIGHMYPVTLSVLKEEMPRLRRKGIRFVKASELVD
jgi:polysaccharide deacetylase 2 family uncharacterized protein YibQ